MVSAVNKAGNQAQIDTKGKSQKTQEKQTQDEDQEVGQLLAGKGKNKAGETEGTEEQGKYDGLPPGLAKRDKLPPGLEKRKDNLPPGLAKKLKNEEGAEATDGAEAEVATEATQTTTIDEITKLIQQLQAKLADMVANKQAQTDPAQQQLVQQQINPVQQQLQQIKLR